MVGRILSVVIWSAFSLLAVLATVPAHAADVRVFVSSFAPGEQGAIHACRLDVQSGKLERVSRTSDAEHPFFIAVSPNKQFLYSIHAPGQFGGDQDEQVAAYKIHEPTGKLKLLNRQSARGSAACYLDVDATGQTVVVANYSTGSVVALPVNKDGSLGKPASFVQHAGSSVDKNRQTGPHAHSIVISPDNRFAFAADLGLDQVLGYRLDPKMAMLRPNTQTFVRTPPGGGPRHLTFHPNGRHIYVINELTNSVTGFAYHPQSGMLIEQKTLSTLPADFEGTSYCADLKITPNGKFLYGTNRGHDSIAAYRIDADGRLSLLEIIPSLGKGPQNLCITAGGELLLCANMPGNNVAVFRIDNNTGKLTKVGSPLTITSPSCIRIP